MLTQIPEDSGFLEDTPKMSWKYGEIVFVPSVSTQAVSPS